MTDGEWWRKSGPWSERPGGGPEADADSGSGGAARAPSAPGPVPDFDPVPVPDPDPDSVYDPPAPSAAGIPSVPLHLPENALEERVDAPPPTTVSSTGPWTMTLFDFSDGPRPAPKPIPEQRTGEEAEAAPEPAAPTPADLGKKPRRGLFKAAPAAPPAPPEAPAGKGAGKGRAAGKGKTAGKGKGKSKGKEAEKGAPARKPSPLLLLSCALLVGGAVSGFLPAMLAGWGLGYLSRQLSDLARKFVILGIPLVTMSATTLYSMRQAKQAGGQGGGLQSGSPLGQISWSSAPNVLRLAAVLSAVVLLLLAMRRRPPKQG
ncbi:hypothetical protein ACFWP2_02685 [Kitasatospora sp. NPDC058444]|uniref:hypothetical protein n=1 Tax=Kitasatospora sp. NPDC058444 TaxID=3346504 RepID=UPI00366797C8